MNKKVLCGMLSAAVLLGTFPSTALALESELNLPEMKDGLDFCEMEEDASGEGWSWDADDQTLTLKNFQATIPIFVMEEEPVFCLPDESTVELDGDDNIIEVLSYQAHAFYCEGELTVCGDGKLEVHTGTYGTDVFHLKGGPLTIEDEAEITVYPEGHVIYVEKAKGRKPIISILDEAQIIFPEEDADDRSVLVTHTSSVKPADNWLNFDEDYDDFDETIILKAKTEKTEDTDKDKEEVPETPVDPAKDAYTIKIGDNKILKNGEVSYTADVSPYLKNGYTMLPLRALLEVSDPDLKITWIAETQSAHTFVNHKLVTIRPGEATYTKVTDKIELSTPAETVNGRLFVSLRDWMNIMEIDSTQLDWDAATKTVTLKY